MNGGKCVDKPDIYECNCQPGFTGPNCITGGSPQCFHNSESLRFTLLRLIARVEGRLETEKARDSSKNNGERTIE